MERGLAMLPRRLIVVMVLAAVAVVACERPGGERTPATHSRTFLTRPFLIDRIFKSMEGPFAHERVALLEGGAPELLWITRYRAEVVGMDAEEAAASQEFMCHNNLSFDARKHRERFGWEKPVRTNRLFTLSQGQFAIDLPAGFGIPVMSDEALTLETQVLNHNHENPNVQVRHRTTVEFVRDADLDRPLKPVFPAGAFVMALLEGEHGYFGVQHPSATQSPASCLPGMRPEHAQGPMMPDYTDPQGKKFTGHWVVKPGREVRHTLVTDLLKVPFDTTIHFVAVHLHPFAESLELKDLTTGETLFKSLARGPESGIGLTHVDHYASEEGIPIYADHEYEMVSIYDNPTGVDQDAMASMFFYLLDKEAEPGLERLRQARGRKPPGPVRQTG